jgi:hypothetical protein
LIQSKDRLPVLEIFQIKYGIVEHEIRNNFSYWNVSKIGIEFELKINEARVFEIRSNLRKFDWTFQGLLKLEQGVPDCTHMTHQLMTRNLETQIRSF